VFENDVERLVLKSNIMEGLQRCKSTEASIGLNENETDKNILMYTLPFDQSDKIHKLISLLETELAG
jgi:hypothetical protein